MQNAVSITTPEQYQESVRLLDHYVASNHRPLREVRALRKAVLHYAQHHVIRDLATLSLPTRLRLEMANRNVNQLEFAALLGVHTSRLNEILNGKRKANLDFIRRLWKRAGMNADELLRLPD